MKKHIIIFIILMFSTSHLYAKNYIVDMIPQVRHPTGIMETLFSILITYNQDAEEYEFKYTASNFSNPPYDYFYMSKIMFEKLSELHKLQIKFNILDPSTNQLKFRIELEPKSLTGDFSSNIAKYAAAESVSHNFLQCMADLKFQKVTRMFIVHGSYFNCK